MISNHEWLARNSIRSFPVREGAIVVSSSSGWSLAPGLIVDAKFTSDLSEGTSFFLHSVTVSPRICSIVIGDSTTGDSLGCAAFVRGVNGVAMPIPIRPVVDGFAGFVTFGPAMLDEMFDSIPKGMHMFGPDTLFEARCGISIGSMPVRSLATPSGSAGGSITVVTNDSLFLSVSRGEDDGDPVDMIQLSLVDPVKFLSPCEGKTSPCECRSIPISSVNGVAGDADGVITLELEDENGNIYLLGKSSLQVSILRSAQALCSKVKTPDQYGRLPGPSGSYDSDAKPVSSYKNPKDKTFPEPVI